MEGSSCDSHFKDEDAEAQRGQAMHWIWPVHHWRSQLWPRRTALAMAIMAQYCRTRSQMLLFPDLEANESPAETSPALPGALSMPASICYLSLSSYLGFPVASKE